MGMATCKAGDIYDQPFFGSIDWRAIEELRVRPPFVPEVVSVQPIDMLARHQWARRTQLTSGPAHTN